MWPSDVRSVRAIVFDLGRPGDAHAVEAARASARPHARSAAAMSAGAGMRRARRRRGSATATSRSLAGSERQVEQQRRAGEAGRVGEVRRRGRRTRLAQPVADRPGRQRLEPHGARCDERAQPRRTVHRERPGRPSPSASIALAPPGWARNCVGGFAWNGRHASASVTPPRVAAEVADAVARERLRRIGRAVAERARCRARDRRRASAPTASAGRRRAACGVMLHVGPAQHACRRRSGRARARRRPARGSSTPSSLSSDAVRAAVDAEHRPVRLLARDTRADSGRAAPPSRAAAKKALASTGGAQLELGERHDLGRAARRR